MSRFNEFITQFFGDQTPSHKFEISKKGRQIKVHQEIIQAKNPITVRYEPGIEIKINPEKEYRPFGEDEVIFAREIYFFGEGMSNGYTTEGNYFKAMADPIEITPLKIIPAKKSA